MLQQHTLGSGLMCMVSDVYGTWNIWEKEKAELSEARRSEAKRRHGRALVLLLTEKKSW